MHTRLFAKTERPTTVTRRRTARRPTSPPPSERRSTGFWNGSISPPTPRPKSRGQAAALHDDLARELSDAALAEAGARAREILEQLENSRLLSRLRELTPGIVGRELPLILARPGADGPNRAAVGSIDLLYRDPEDGQLVVADYKTDRVAPGDDLAARAEIYAAQGAVYVDAVQAGARLELRPRFELWFLAADTIHIVAT